MLAQPGSTSPIVNQLENTVVSVVPPKLTIRAPGKAWRMRSGRVTGIQSPARNTSRKRLAASGRVGNRGASRTKAAGAEFHRVIPPLRSRLTRRSGSASSSPVATWTVPPAASIPNMS